MNYSIGELSGKLSERTEEVCLLLLPHGKRNRNLWEVGDSNGSNGKSCKIQLDGDHRGKWRDWANESERGDLIDLWGNVRGLNRVETLRQVKEYLGIKESIAPMRQKVYAAPPTAESVKKISDKGKVMSYFLDKRKIEASIVNRFQIEGDGENIVYPSYSIDGNLLNRSYVRLERDEKDKKIVRQEKGCAPALWGWHGLDDEAFQDRAVLLCEGQIDCMTWTQWGVPSLSVPNGVGNMAWIEYEWEHLELFSTIYLSFDMDGAGRDNAQKAMSRLGLHRCRIVEIPHKDANAALQAGFTAEQAKKAVEESQYPKHQGLKGVMDYESEITEEFFPSPNKINGYRPPLLQRFDGGMEFLPGDVTVWTGVSSHGKTSFLNYLAISGVLEDRKAAIASLEMKPARLIARMVRSMTKKLNLTIEEIGAACIQLEDKLFFADKIGYIARQELLDIMLFAYSRYGVENFFIDSLMRISGLEEDYPAQGDFLNELQAFSKRTNAHVHLVCHPRKTSEEHAPGKLDVKGSSLIMNNCDNLIAIHKNMEKERLRRERPLTDEEDQTMYDAEIVSEKQRDKGWHGRVLLRFCNKTFSYSAFKG